MTTPILKTKLFIPPLRQGLVSRPRLIQRLNAGLRGELVLVSAPAGFGKTTLLSAWACQYKAAAGHFAWLSLDAGDNDPARFWRYVIAALRGVTTEIEPLQASLESLVTGLINEFVAHGEKVATVLSLDFPT